MIRRRFSRNSETEVVGEPKGFDDFDLRLGDVMRGERATMGKSLLDVQRELRIKASYIAAIENADPSAFDTPGFIAGYVRSYARYLGMDPNDAYETFCQESGFSSVHGMSAAASSRRNGEADGFKPAGLRDKSDPFISPNTPFIPTGDGIMSRIEPRAIGSSLVLVALIAGLGFGGWSVLNEIQRVQVAPVENTPDVLSDLDPLEAATTTTEIAAADNVGAPSEGLDRLYRPQALDVPVLVARDAPISTLDPRMIGSFTPDETPTIVASTFDALPDAPTPQVVEEQIPEVVLFAVRPAWVRVRAADGTTIFEKILDAGEEYVLPVTEEPPTLQAGMSGSIYFNLNGELHGPAGEGTNTVRNLALSVDSLTKNYDVADMSRDPELAKIIALAEAQNVTAAQD